MGLLLIAIGIALKLVIESKAPKPVLVPGATGSVHGKCNWREVKRLDENGDGEEDEEKKALV